MLRTGENRSCCRRSSSSRSTGSRAEFLNGYRIGRYPEKPLRGLADYVPPAGFVEVTRENENVLVSPHFRLKQFLCKQPAGSRKYVVLNERLLLALEYILERVNEAGYRATTFHIMSGYRTPAYNGRSATCTTACTSGARPRTSSSTRTGTA